MIHAGPVSGKPTRFTGPQRSLIEHIFAKLGVLLFTFIWIRGTLPRTRVDQVMNFAWRFMLPMAFACIIAAAVWHYRARGLSGWLWSLAVLVIAYTALTSFLHTRRQFALRVYRFAE